MSSTFSSSRYHAPGSRLLLAEKANERQKVRLRPQLPGKVPVFVWFITPLIAGNTFPLTQLVACQDEDEQAEYVVRQILERFEEGIELREQAVLFRASHNSMVLEAELARRNIPFVK